MVSCLWWPTSTLVHRNHRMRCARKGDWRDGCPNGMLMREVNLHARACVVLHVQPNERTIVFEYVCVWTWFIYVSTTKLPNLAQSTDRRVELWIYTMYYSTINIQLYRWYVLVCQHGIWVCMLQCNLQSTIKWTLQCIGYWENPYKAPILLARRNRGSCGMFACQQIARVCYMCCTIIYHDSHT